MPGESARPAMSLASSHVFGFQPCFVHPRAAGLALRKRQCTILTNCADDSSFCLNDGEESSIRREIISGLIQAASSLQIQKAAAREIQIDTSTDGTVTLPLEPASGGTLCVRCTLFDAQSGAFKVYRAIVDTGSPYLVLPSTEEPTAPSSWMGTSVTNVLNAFGSTRLDYGDRLLLQSEYAATEEIYGSVKGQIDWKLAEYKFRDPRLRISSSDERGIVGVLDEALTKEATGGADIEPYALLGLIQNSNPNADRSRFPDPRPTFVEQEQIILVTNDRVQSKIISFSVNGPEKELVLSTSSLITSDDNVMSLVDLRRYGDFVDHYAVKVNSVTFDGVAVSSKLLQRVTNSLVERPIVAVFDSGLTGCLLTRPFWDAMQQIKLKEETNRSDTSDQFHSVAISVNNSAQRNRSGSTNTKIQSSKEEDPRLFYVDPIDLDWFDDEQTCPYVIVLGQTFLSKGNLIIDMERRVSSFKAVI
jgi:hypothetical protein